jgi:hypothetical protein
MRFGQVLLALTFFAAASAVGCAEVEGETGSEDLRSCAAPNEQAQLQELSRAAESCDPSAELAALRVDRSGLGKWRHIGTRLTIGAATHRGRDTSIAVGSPQWVLGKFAYGVTDKDLKDEAVDIYVDTNCKGEWSKLNSKPVLTTREDDAIEAEGVVNTGGRVYFQIPPEKLLGIGRHRVRRYGPIH